MCACTKVGKSMETSFKKRGALEWQLAHKHIEFPSYCFGANSDLMSTVCSSAVIFSETDSLFFITILCNAHLSLSANTQFNLFWYLA